MKSRLGGVVMAVTAAAGAAMLMGCSINLPSTTRVQFDYSDYAHYDRGHAPSPSAAHASPAFIERMTAEGRAAEQGSDEEHVAGR